MGGFGKLLMWGAGIIMFVFELVWFFEWWGGVGVVASFLIPPLAVFFPFVFLFMEGFSLVYFGLWGVALFGTFLVAQAEG